ncbi:winged helix-turn-helix domain-containing protein [Aliikangiella coralliicola]|uniref:OmpR/PhoB-type domain-containing protein n=1 Tax=Aliikangiella coralliicola TaxID=2592383 RepID=A0A545UJ12_9GAMM|nr:winged helix-turn-helix domain-containing protein [Aliikangiella coralliicola]TQV89445.1 hypothetical protein FLL46_00770 [Aliikangiella coralliicola]
MNSITHLKIGCCNIYPQEYAIQFDDQEKINLQPKFIEVIVYLANHYPGVISRNELIDNIWNGNYYVGEKSLTNAVWQLRKNLNGTCGKTEVIETIRKMGYRLLIEPEILASQNPQIKEAASSVKPKSLWRYLPYVALIIISCGLGWYYGTSQDVEVEPTIVTITTEPGRELLAAPSPDGRYLAYKWKNADHNKNLYMRDLNQPDMPPKQLTFDNATVGHSVWSNSGEYLFFSRADYAKDLCHIIKMNVFTQQEEVVAHCAGDGGYRYLSISPDDKTLAYRGDHDKNLDTGIYFVDLREESSTPVRFSCGRDCGYRDRDMAFSPDGKKLLVSRRKNSLSENIYLVDLQTKEAEQLTEGEENIVGFSWHPDGDRIVFSAERSDVYNGYLLNLETGKKQSLNIEGFSFPVFTRHEKPTLFYLERSERKFISALNLNDEIASSPFPILKSSFSHHTPDYSHVAKKIAYVSNESGYYELWVSNNNGEERQKLTNLKSTVKYPRWSHDGKRIAFLAHVEKKSGDKLYIIDVQSKQLKVLSTSFDDHNRPSWSFNDQSIISSVYAGDGFDLYSFNITSSESIRLTHDGGRFGIMASPEKMLYTKRGKNGLWQLDLSQPTDSPDRITEIINGRDFIPRYTWGYSLDGIYFRRNVKKHQRIIFYRFADSSLTPLVKLPGISIESFGSLSLIEDTHQLVFTQRGDVQGNIKQLTHPMFY